METRAGIVNSKPYRKQARIENEWARKQHPKCVAPAKEDPGPLKHAAQAGGPGFHPQHLQTKQNK